MADKLTGDALDKRVRELGIDETLNADEKRAEIEKIELQTAEGKAQAEALEANPGLQQFTLQEILDRPRLVGLRRFEVKGAYDGVPVDTSVAIQDVQKRVKDWSEAEAAEH